MKKIKKLKIGSMITGLDCFDAFGDPNTVWDEGRYMCVWDVPEYIHKRLHAIPRRIYCNKEMPLALEIALYNVIDRGYTNDLKTWDGCFQVRPIRGYERKVKELIASGQIEKAMIYMSIHSWGVAIDINAFENGLGMQPRMKLGFVKCFTDAGFEWGGTWKRADGMHFQLSYLT